MLCDFSNGLKAVFIELLREEYFRTCLFGGLYTLIRGQNTDENGSSTS
jgi:hypothetical protein